MLQSVGVPARVVNGYKGCEKNSVTGQWEVKQKHAHTWLEAYIDRRWETIDPTPAAAREEIVSQTGTFDWWQDLKTAFSDGWFVAVQKMSLQKQEEFIRPWINAIRDGFETIRKQGLWASLKMFYYEVILQPKKWVSWKTGVVTFFLLLGLGLIIQRRPDHWLRRRLRKILNWLRPERSAERTVVRFYENFCHLCSRHGLSFPQHQTARENAELATSHFAQFLVDRDDRSLPTRIADAFNTVRFGKTVLSDDAVAAVRNDVIRFSNLLNQTA